MGKLSRDKGKRGELELVKFLKGFGYEARRGQQYKGTPDSPDVIHNLPGNLHIEVKRTETLSLYKALTKADEDADDQDPIVFHRRNGEEWAVIMYAEDFMKLLLRNSTPPGASPIPRRLSLVKDDPE